MGGLFGRMGALPGYALVFVMASLGLPGTANFIGEFLILFGTFRTFPWVAGIACVGLVLAAIYALMLMHRAFWGQPQSESTLGALTVREYGMLFALLLLTLLIGLYPQFILNVSQISMAEVARSFAALPPPIS